MWLTETPWPPLAILTLATIACGWMWLERRQSWWLAGVIGCVALSVGVWVIERAVITPREQIEQHILDFARAFQDRDNDKTLSFISPRAQDVRAKVALGFLTVTNVERLRITDTKVTLLAEDTRAKLHFRANGTFTVRGYGDIGHQPTRWLMTWQLERDLWKVIDVERLDIITGEPIGLVDARR